MTMVSVIVPVYNMEAYLPRCIDSIFDQTYRDFELVSFISYAPWWLLPTIIHLFYISWILEFGAVSALYRIRYKTDNEPEFKGPDDIEHDYNWEEQTKVFFVILSLVE